MAGPHGRTVDFDVDEPLPEFQLLEVHPDASVVVGVNDCPDGQSGCADRCLRLAHLTLSISVSDSIVIS
jgi:hypothetical protein